jgi:hypothetical protein
LQAKVPCSFLHFFHISSTQDCMARSSPVIYQMPGFCFAPIAKQIPCVFPQHLHSKLLWYWNCKRRPETELHNRVLVVLAAGYTTERIYNLSNLVPGRPYSCCEKQERVYRRLDRWREQRRQSQAQRRLTDRCGRDHPDSRKFSDKQMVISVAALYGSERFG